MTVGSYSTLIKQSPLRVPDTSGVTPFDITLLPDSLAKEPKLQLWHYGPLDSANKYERENHQASCTPELAPTTICVNWHSTENQIYPFKFAHQKLYFAVELQAYRSNVQSYRGELRTPSILITLPETVDSIEIRFTLLLTHGLPQVTPYQQGVPGTSLSVERISAHEARILWDGPLCDAVFVKAGGAMTTPTPDIPGTGGDVVIAPGGDGSAGDGDDGMMIISEICYHCYSQTVLRKEADDAANPYNPTTFRNALMLETNRQYRLSVTTFVDCKPIEGRGERKQTTEQFFFRTGDLPGTEYPEALVDFADKKPNDLATCVNASVPDNGAEVFYYDYDIAVRFADSYIEQLYKGTLTIRIKNQNDQILGSASNH